jgi:transcriptional regulator with XRE-family HTH domain
MAVKIGAEKIQGIGRIVQFHRKEAGLSRIDLADIAGVGKTVVYDIENGKETVRLRTLFNVLGVLNISLSLDSPLMDRYKAGDDAQG